MHEKFDKEMERQTRRLDKKIFNPPTVTTLNDIKRVIAELDPRRAGPPAPPVSSRLVGEDQHGRRITYSVSAQTDQHSKRSIVVSGFEFIKSRLELEDKLRANTVP